MKPIRAGHSLRRRMNSLPVRKKSLPGQVKFPAPARPGTCTFAHNALELQRKVTPRRAGTAASCKKTPYQIPCTRDFEDQARSCVPGSLDIIRILETPNYESP